MISWVTFILGAALSFDSAFSLKGLVPLDKYLKTDLICQNPASEQVRKPESLVVPLGSGYQFLCPFCFAQKDEKISLDSLWFFLPSDEIAVHPIPGKKYATTMLKKNNYTVDINGTLEVVEIFRDGIWYCVHNGVIRAEYSVTTTSFPIQPTSKQVRFDADHKKWEDVQFVLHQQKIHSTECSMQNSKPGFRRIIYQYYVNVTFPSAFIPQVKFYAALLKLQHYKTINVFDFEVHAFLRDTVNIFHFTEPAVYYYELCKEDGFLRNWEENMTMQYDMFASISKMQVFMTKYGQYSDSIVFSCAYRGVKEYRWRRIHIQSEKDGKGPQVHQLSPLYLPNRTHKRLSIDFLNNLHIHYLYKEDFEYRYACYMGDKQVASFKVKVNITSESASLLPNSDTITIICAFLGILWIAKEILGNPDIRQ